MACNTEQLLAYEEKLIGNKYWAEYFRACSTEQLLAHEKELIGLAAAEKLLDTPGPRPATYTLHRLRIELITRY